MAEGVAERMLFEEETLGVLTWLKNSSVERVGKLIR